MLTVHRAERADRLAAALAELLGAAPADPFTPELVAVPARGVERWLAQRLCSRLGSQPGRADGICAGIAFPSPAQLLEEAVAGATGIDASGDPWRPERCCWTLLELVQELIDAPWLEPLAAYLAGADARRLPTVRHIAGLFHRYALQRPDLLEAWRTGEDDGAPAPGSARGWQAPLWRALRARLGGPDPVERVLAACATLERDPGTIALPPRIFLFGLTRIAPGHLRVLRALARWRELHLFLLHPSPELWERIEGAAGLGAPERALDRSSELAEHPLLRSWGRDVRELQRLLLAAGPSAARHHPVEERRDPAPTLLELIQAGIRANRRPAGAPLAGDPERRPALDDEDRSVRVHACHGRARQVEVLREAILHALAQDETLQPRDVIVMCPDIETFAPLIRATFAADWVDGGADPDAPAAPASGLRVRLADRSLRETNPLLGLLATLLELAAGRVSASQVLDLADREPVRRRFGFEDDDLGRLRAWTAAAGVRWGLDAQHRAPFGLGELANGTWRAGLDRLLLGVAVSEEGRRRFAGVLPLDDLDSGSIDLAGRFAELVARLGRTLARLSSRQPLAAWCLALRRAAEELGLAPARDGWQRAELERLLDELAAEAGGCSLGLVPAELRELLAERLAARPTRANFRTGELTVCTLVPMRSVPHRVVCLLGLDDLQFPRRAPSDGEDVLLEAPRIGERDPRSEDRQLLLDALMAAGERVIVTYTGADERSGAARPPAVPVEELLETVDRTVRAGGTPARERVLVRHPLQPFHPANFTPGRLQPQGPWSFDAFALAGARAARAQRRPPSRFLGSPLPELDEPACELADLLAFLRHPVRAFLHARLGLGSLRFEQRIDDALPLELAGLERWRVGQDYLHARLDGVSASAARRAAIAGGALPPGNLARSAQGIFSEAEAVYRAALELGSSPSETLEVHCELPGGGTITGTVPGLSGETLLSSSFSKLSPGLRLASWAQLLALTLARPERPWRAAMVALPGDAGRWQQRIPPLASSAAQRRALAAEGLAALADLRRRGLREPLPLFSATSCAYASARAQGADPDRAARARWEGHEAKEPEHRLVLGEVAAYARVAAAPPAEDEHGPGWDPGTASRLGRLACRLWDPLLEREALCG
jgi:exodeoxyribonuclease V gamma subunit